MREISIDVEETLMIGEKDQRPRSAILDRARDKKLRGAPTTSNAPSLSQQLN
jgi:hypothetical protein